MSHPRPRASPDELHEALATPDWPAEPQRILIAEDELLVAKSLANDLTELGYQVIGPAPNGQQAIETARREKVDLALLDIRMPVMDGLAAAEVFFKELNIPVIILSAFSDPAYIQAGARVGVYGYLLKPASYDDLRVTIAISWNRFVRHQQMSKEVGDLQNRLEQRKLIERAKGLLMSHMKLTEEEAMRTLQRKARDARRPMAELAKSIIDAHMVMDGHNGPTSKAGDKPNCPPANPTAGQ